jgi:AcrR family transcriptional regulator
MQRRKRAKPEAKPRTRLDVDERRTQLLALGLGLFAARPYDDISIDDLARAAGISKGLLYHYFPTKRDFYVAALEEAAQQLVARVRAADSGPEASILERVTRGLDAYLTFVHAHATAYVALMRGGIGADGAVVRILDRTRDAFFERMLDDVPAEIVTPLLRAAFRGYIGFVETAALDWVEKRELPREALLHLCTGALAAAIELGTEGKIVLSELRAR